MGLAGRKHRPSQQEVPPKVTHDGTRPESPGLPRIARSFDETVWKLREKKSLPHQFGFCALGAKTRSLLQIGVEEPLDLPEVRPQEPVVGESGVAVEADEGIQACIAHVDVEDPL